MIDKLKVYKKYIRNYFLYTEKSMKQSSKLELMLFLDFSIFKTTTIRIKANSIKDLNEKIENIFYNEEDYTVFKTKVQNIIDTHDYINETQLTLFY